MAKPFTKKGWRNLKIIAGGIDVIQIMIDAIPGAGEGANAIADLIIGPVFGLVYWRKGAITWGSFIALILSFGGEEASLSAAPLWVLDVWYTQTKAPPSPEDVATVVDTAYVNQNGVRRPDNAGQKPLNIKDNGKSLRPPSPVNQQQL